MRSILLSPYWVSYEITVRLAGGVPRHRQGGCRGEFQGAAGADRRSPHAQDQASYPQLAQQPDRRRMDEAELAALAEVVHSHPRLMVLSDEIYEYILFDGKMISFAGSPACASAPSR